MYLILLLSDNMFENLWHIPRKERLVVRSTSVSHLRTEVSGDTDVPWFLFRRQLSPSSVSFLTPAHRQFQLRELSLAKTKTRNKRRNVRTRSPSSQTTPLSYSDKLSDLHDFVRSFSSFESLRITRWKNRPGLHSIEREYFEAHRRNSVVLEERGCRREAPRVEICSRAESVRDFHLIWNRRKNRPVRAGREENDCREEQPQVASKSESSLNCAVYTAARAKNDAAVRGRGIDKTRNGRRRRYTRLAFLSRHLCQLGRITGRRQNHWLSLQILPARMVVVSSLLGSTRSTSSNSN